MTAKPDIKDVFELRLSYPRTADTPAENRIIELPDCASGLQMLASGVTNENGTVVFIDPVGPDEEWLCVMLSSYAALADRLAGARESRSPTGPEVPTSATE
jgi:hypothetical protein